KRPMFVVAPRGDVWDIVRDLPGTVLCEPEQVEEIANQIALQVEQHRCGIKVFDQDWNIEHFHRKRLTGELAEVLDQAIELIDRPESTLQQLINQQAQLSDQEGMSRE